MKYGQRVLCAGAAAAVLVAAVTVASGPAVNLLGGEVGPPPVNWQPPRPVGPPPVDWRPPAPDGGRISVLDDAHDRGLTAVATKGSLNALAGNQYMSFGDEFWMIEADNGWRFVVLDDEHNLTVYNLTNGAIEARIEISGGEAATFVRTISEVAPHQHSPISGPEVEPGDCTSDDECGDGPGAGENWWAWCWCLASCTCTSQNRVLCQFNASECSFVCCESSPVVHEDKNLSSSIEGDQSATRLAD